jgi:hypothetical protein
VFGWKSFAYSLENFCHSPLFEITEYDLLFVFSSKSHSLTDKVKKLCDLLKKRKIQVFVIDIPDYDDIKVLLFATFLMQFFVVKLAKRLKYENCYFLENRELLDISSRLIYDI